MKDNCDGKCTNCDETELTNIKDKNCDGIGYSYAYKSDCAGDRYIKIDEVRYLLKCERNKAIDDFADYLRMSYDKGMRLSVAMCNNEIEKFKLKALYSKFIDAIDDCVKAFNEMEQLKEGGENEQSI